ncbi:MAG: hypothetical protein GX660_24350 [Clostridiaceae bacterium]|nr:hypothetical protein [Clostridiaceae bacterium]
MRQWRVGTFTMGIALVAIGAVMLVAQINGYSALDLILKWWPLVLVMLGIEVLVYIALSKQEEPRLKFDGFSIFMLVIIMIFSAGAFTVSSVASAIRFNPSFLSKFNIYKDESTFKKNYTVETKGRDKLSVENHSGNVEVVKGDNANIEIEANIKIQHNDEEETVAQIAESIVEISETNIIKVSNESGKVASRNNRYTISVDYYIKVPEKMSVEVESKFGDVLVDGIDLSAVVKNSNGSTVLKSIGTDIKVDSSFGDVSAENVGGKAEVELKNGTLVLRNIDGSLNASNAFGDIDVNNIKGDVTLSGSNGDINAGRVEGKLKVNGKFSSMSFVGISGNADIEGGNGNIYLEEADGDVKVRNSFGNIDVVNAHKAIDLKGGNGDISLDTSKLIEKDVSITNKFGNIFIEIPENQNGHFDLKTSFGSITNGFGLEVKEEINRHNASGTLVNDDVKFNIDNANGDISVEKS